MDLDDRFVYKMQHSIHSSCFEEYIECYISYAKWSSKAICLLYNLIDMYIYIYIYIYKVVDFFLFLLVL